MSRTALLLMDLQLANIAQMPPSYLADAVRALETARAAEIPVIHVVLQLRPGHVDTHPRNKVFGSLPDGFFTADDPNAAIHPDLAPRDGEIVVTKNRVSAFTGNNLQQILSVQGIDHLVLAGLSTGGIVLSTTLQAFDLDYSITILSDGCADRDPDLHETLLTKVFNRRCEVTTISDWKDSLAKDAVAD